MPQRWAGADERRGRGLLRAVAVRPREHAATVELCYVRPCTRCWAIGWKDWGRGTTREP